MAMKARYTVANGEVFSQKRDSTLTTTIWDGDDYLQERT
jgi:hypothetical protein